MKTNYRDAWPTSHRCEHTEQKRQGRHDDISPAKWMVFGVLMGMLVFGPGVTDLFLELVS